MNCSLNIEFNSINAQNDSLQEFVILVEYSTKTKKLINVLLLALVNYWLFNGCLKVHSVDLCY